MLSAPRRSPLQPNVDGTLGLYTVSTYSFESHTKTKEIRLFDLQTKRSTLLTNAEKTSEPHWLESEILYLKVGEEKGTTELLVASVDGTTKTYSVAVVPGTISDLKLKPIQPGRVAMVCTGKTTREGKLWNSEKETKRNHTGTLYDSTFVRHWDAYVDTTRNSLWYGVFTLDEEHGTEANGRWVLSELVNALADSELEAPIPPHGGDDGYDISTDSIVFVAQDPHLNPAFHTKCDFYHVAVPDFAVKPSAPPRIVQAKGFKGAASSPAISPDGKSAAFLQMVNDGYEADKNRVLLVQDLGAESTAVELFASDDGRGAWDTSPSKIAWSADGLHLYLIAEHEGKGLLYDASLDAVVRNLPPQMLTHSSHTSSVVPLSTDKLLLAGDSLVDNSVWTVLEVAGGFAVPTVISSNSDHGAAFGLSHRNVSEMWFTGAKGRRVQAWVLKPSKAPAAGDKLPLAMLIHGGPQGAWADAWSTRWNLAVFAEQGYMVVAPNPTGSTSFGQAFTDAINNNWGGDPYEDVVACFEHVASTIGDEVDMDRAVALGASYGGYMVNWIQGHDLGRKFKALVCHDGVFSTEFAIAQEEQYFPVHDLGGQVWEVPENYAKWNPVRFTGNWATPQLIVHSEKDYRLAMSEGLAAFNVLQARGVPSRLLYFPDENHFVQKEENSLVWHTVVINWINSYVGLPPYADEDKIVGPAVGKKYAH